MRDPFITHTEIRSFADYTYLLPSIPQGEEPGLVDTFSPESGIECLYESITHFT